MSDAPDKESKTEHPTEKRLQDAFEKGNKPFSAEVVTLGSFAMLMVAMHFLAKDSFASLAQTLASSLESVGDVNLENGPDSLQVLKALFLKTGLLILPFLLLLALGGLLGSVIQNPPSMATDRVSPKLLRLSPASNLSRMFGKDGLVALIMMLVKATVVAGVTLFVLRSLMIPTMNASQGDVAGISDLIVSAFKSVLLPLCVVAAVLAVLDMTKVRFKWLHDLMMTRHEIKEEMKQSDGDPHVKQKFKSIGRQRLNSRMMDDVPRATVVVVNPTHFAVALRYVPSEGGAPLVLAKGIDYMALRIRGKCEELGIPFVEDKPLAQSLYKSVEVGQMIPVEFYRAVAEIIHFVEMRKRFAART